MNYWLFKSEPSVYSIDDLKRDGKTYWEGVRNYQARNFLRDKIKKKDRVFFYHSNAEPSGIAGIAEVTKEGFPDPDAFDKKSKYYDEKSKKESPTWYVVEIKFLRKYDQLFSLEKLRTNPKLKDMLLLRKGQRLSVQPVTKTEWEAIHK